MTYRDVEVGFRLRAGIAAALSIVLVVSADVVVTGPARASVDCGSVGYAYDAAGRLVGVTDSAGNAASYRYDAVGNLLSVERRATESLRVLSFSPASGVAGTAVSITGGCFSGTASENAVSFNGVPATVTSASTNWLVATVPAGATTGPVTVTVGGAVGTSAASFIVLSVGAGVWVMNGSFRRLPEVAGAGELGSVVEWALGASTGGTPFQPVLDDLGLGSYADYLAGLRSTIVKRDGAVVTVTPCRFVPGSGWARVVISSRAGQKRT